jgi:hypothetical protein
MSSSMLSKPVDDFGAAFAPRPGREAGCGRLP